MKYSHVIISLSGDVSGRNTLCDILGPIAEIYSETALVSVTKEGQTLVLIIEAADDLGTDEVRVDTRNGLTWNSQHDSELYSLLQKEGCVLHSVHLNGSFDTEMQQPNSWKFWIHTDVIRLQINGDERSEVTRVARALHKFVR